MNSIEKGFIAKEQMSDAENTHKEVFSTDNAVSQERTILDQISGKAREAAKIMMLFTALSSGPGIVKEAYAQDRQSPPKTEQLKQESKINEANLTESSKFFAKIVADMKNDISEVKTAEDVEWLFRSHFDKFTMQFFIPTSGNVSVEEGPYGLKSRSYSEDDIKYILEQAVAMKQLLEDLRSKFEVESYEGRADQIGDMISRLERRASYAGRKQHELLKKLREMYEDK